MRIDANGPGLTDRREWVCELPDGTGRIACGGTHVTTLAALGSVRVRLTSDGAAQQLTMHADVAGRPAGPYPAGADHLRPRG